jgi:hypothetical protein
MSADALIVNGGVGARSLRIGTQHIVPTVFAARDEKLILAVLGRRPKSVPGAMLKSGLPSLGTQNRRWPTKGRRYQEIGGRRHILSFGKRARRLPV